MVAAVELGTSLVREEVGLLSQTPRLSCRLDQWRLLRGQSGQDCHSSSSTSDPATVGLSLMVGLAYTLGGSIVCDES